MTTLRDGDQPLHPSTPREGAEHDVDEQSILVAKEQGACKRGGVHIRTFGSGLPTIRFHPTQEEPTVQDGNQTRHEPWNKGKLIGQKPPLKLPEIWAIRIRLELSNRLRDLTLFNLAIDSKLRGCDLVRLRVRDVANGDRVLPRALIIQQKTKRPVQFEITTPTQETIAAWTSESGLRSGDYLFPSRISGSPHLSTRQYARRVRSWVAEIGLDPEIYGTHSIDTVFGIQGSSCLLPRPSGLSLLYFPGLPPSASARSPDTCASVLPYRHWPSDNGDKLLTAPNVRKSASCGDSFRRLVRSLSLRPSWLLASLG